MNTPDSITERLNAKADAALKAEIESHLKAIFHGFDDYTAPEKERYLTNKDFTKVWWWTLRNAVLELAIQGRTPIARSREISAFMDKLEAAESAIRELKGESQ